LYLQSRITDSPTRAGFVCEECVFIRREGKDTGEAAFSALESHFQETLKSNRLSLGRETRPQSRSFGARDPQSQRSPNSSQLR